MKAVVKDLLDIQRNYKYAYGYWKTLQEKLREYEEIRRKDNFPAHSNLNDNCIAYDFAGTKLICMANGYEILALILRRRTSISGTSLSTVVVMMRLRT